MRPPNPNSNTQKQKRFSEYAMKDIRNILEDETITDDSVIVDKVCDVVDRWEEQMFHKKVTP